MKTIRLKESDIQRIVEKVIKKEIIFPTSQEPAREVNHEKIQIMFNTLFPSPNEYSKFLSSYDIPSEYIYYSSNLGKTEEEMVEEYINLTPKQLYEKTKLYEKEFKKRHYNL
tara:strand:- start:734 stop:1069 length:336 start_codon:yes stop_codon:yes gene_type:complete